MMKCCLVKYEEIERILCNESYQNKKYWTLVTKSDRYSLAGYLQYLKHNNQKALIHIFLRNMKQAFIAAHNYIYRHTPIYTYIYIYICIYIYI